MKIEKTDINYLVKNIFTWTFLNFSLNLLGLWMSKLLDKAGFNYLESISNEFVKPILIQSAIFAVVTLVAYIFLRNKKLTLYIFTLVQLLAFHTIFFLNLSSEHMLHFETRIDDNGLKYLSNMGQYFIDVLYLYVPMEGIFKGRAHRVGDAAEEAPDRRPRLTGSGRLIVIRSADSNARASARAACSQRAIVDGEWCISVAS